MADIKKLDLKSKNITEEQKAKLEELFPEVLTEGKIDFEKLRLTLGDEIDEGEERFGMTWPGKRDCFKVIQEPSIGTLKPCRDESVDFDTTDNLFIEGDNLEVLKLLQKSYYGKVKMIYIDPPYNTGNEFIYPDKYSESLETYLAYTGQVDDEGRKFSTNTEADGRFHSKWLNMMYPRLFLAKNLLRDDGVIFISIDDNEVHNLRMIMNEVFGEENFVANFPRITKKAGKTSDLVSKNNDSILCFRKSDNCKFNSYTLSDEGYKYSDEYVATRGQYKLSQTLDYGSIQYSPSLDYEIEFEDEIFRPGGVTREQMKKRRKRNPSSDFCWRWSKALYKFGLEKGFIVLKESKNGERLYTKTYKNATISKNENGYLIEEQERTKLTTTLDFIENKYSNDNSRKELDRIFDKKVFEYSKPSSIIKTLSFLSTNNRDIILDFFAGSATTAHAVLDLNKEDNGNRKFIMVQLPKPCNEKSEAFKAGYSTIADIGKERIRRVIKKINKEKEGALDFGDSKQDIGFKVFKLNKSNFKIWDGDVEEKPIHEQLEFAIDHIDPNSKEDDILYEILLKSGFELTTPIEEITLEGKRVYSVAEGALLICLEMNLTKELIRAIAKMEPQRVVCLDSGFEGNDQLKTNAVQIMKTFDVESFRTV